MIIVKEKSIHHWPLWRTSLVVTMALAIIGGLTAVPAKATDPVGVTTTILSGPISFDPIGVHLRTDDWKIRVETNSATDVYVVDNVFDPNGNTGWHSHPGPSLVTVIAGTLTVYEGDDPTCTPHVYPTGTGFVDKGSDVHLGRNEGTIPTELITTQILPAGAERRIDQPDPGYCSF
jgi:hypothetical protein